MSNGLNVVVVSGTPTKEEQKIIETFKKEDEVEYRHAIKQKGTKRAKICLETILDNYPGFQSSQFGKSLLDVAKGYGNSLQREYFNKVKPGLKKGWKIWHVLRGGYNRLYYPNQVKAGDLCFAGGYGVLLPKGRRFDNLITDLSYGHEITNLDELLLQLGYVHKRIRHYLHTFATKYRNEFFMAAPVFTRYQGRVMRLDDFVSGELPAVCFEKALSLAIVLSRDPALERLKIKSYLTIGYMLAKDKRDKNRWSRQESGSHAWVRIDVPMSAEGFGLRAGSYVLDPSGNGFYSLSNETRHKSKKYIPFEKQNLWGSLYTTLRPKNTPPKYR